MAVHSLNSKNTKSCGCLDIEKSTARFIAIGKKQTGKNNPNYNHSLSEEDRKDTRLTGEYLDWVKQVYKKDNYTCQYCNQVGKNLTAHHLDGWHWSKERRFDVSNGITLCHKCHKKFHKLYGNKNNTEQQFMDFMKDRNV